MRITDGTHESPTHRLTPCERAVLTVLARGVGTNEAAAELGLTPKEVRAALRGAMAALGASSKLEALILALRSGLIAPP